MLKEVLKILENDARTATRQISTMTGLPGAEVTRLIKQAEKDRIILKYKTVVNWDKVENEQVSALIEVRVTPQPEVGFDSVSRAHLSLPGGSHCLPALWNLRPAGPGRRQNHARGG